MRTYVVSNGRKYSDHEVLFVEIQPGQEPFLDAFIRFCADHQGEIYGTPEVLGSADGALVWRVPNSSLSLRKFIDEIAYCVCDDDTEAELKSLKARIPE